MIRRLPTEKVYLTFDDGPCPDSTPAVLDVLAKYNVRATFFMVGERAREHASLAREIVARGHAVGNHSPDHRYHHLFRGHAALVDWVRLGKRMVEDASGSEIVGFRPPAGMCPPPLRRAVAALEEPLLLWSMRYFDAVFTWNAGRALRGLERLRGGDIVLLHDRQRLRRRETFLRTLDLFLTAAHSKELSFAPLSRLELCRA